MWILISHIRQVIHHKRSLMARGLGMWVNRRLSAAFEGWRSYLMWKEQMRKVARDEGGYAIIMMMDLIAPDTFVHCTSM